jgi:hypothetical protein
MEKVYGNEIIKTFVLKSYVYRAAAFGGICHPFRRAMSSMVTLYSAAGVHPKVLQIIAFGLFTAEQNLIIAGLILSSSINQIIERDLFAERPSMRKNRIRRDSIVANKFPSKAEFASIVA